MRGIARPRDVSIRLHVHVLHVIFKCPPCHVNLCTLFTDHQYICLSQRGTYTDNSVLKNSDNKKKNPQKISGRIRHVVRRERRESQKAEPSNLKEHLLGRNDKTGFKAQTSLYHDIFVCLIISDLFGLDAEREENTETEREKGNEERGLRRQFVFVCFPDV